MPLPQLILNAPTLAAGYFVKWCFFMKIGFGKDYVDGLKEGISTRKKCKKVFFRGRDIRNYWQIQKEPVSYTHLIATVVNPEILIVDEILSVGDENFQKKSHARMMELMAGGTTVLYVSHNLDQIREMCNRVVWLENHTVKMFGDVKEVCDAYRL